MFVQIFELFEIVACGSVWKYWLITGALLIRWVRSVLICFCLWQPHDMCRRISDNTNMVLQHLRTGKLPFTVLLHWVIVTLSVSRAGKPYTLQPHFPAALFCMRGIIVLRVVLGLEISALHTWMMPNSERMCSGTKSLRRHGGETVILAAYWHAIDCQCWSLCVADTAKTSSALSTQPLRVMSRLRFHSLYCFAE